ncbi:MAG TPA: energy transducer TonB, partial [Thermodesulfobacteriota bacterium]|nr:energy transducer TonB [Thermodesulfobacteriota bacterium]
LFEVRFKDYYTAVGAKIQSVWIYPGEAAKDLQTVLSIGIARSGELRSVRIEKKSGNSLFDESAIKAVKKAAPFAPIRKEIKEDLLEIGVRFCPGGCSN